MANENKPAEPSKIRVVDVDAMISATAPLAEGAAWFQRLYRRESGLMKVVLLP